MYACSPVCTFDLVTDNQEVRRYNPQSRNFPPMNFMIGRSDMYVHCTMPNRLGDLLTGLWLSLSLSVSH